MLFIAKLQTIVHFFFGCDSFALFIESSFFFLHTLSLYLQQIPKGLMESDAVWLISAKLFFLQQTKAWMLILNTAFNILAFIGCGPK